MKRKKSMKAFLKWLKDPRNAKKFTAYVDELAKESRKRWEAAQPPGWEKLIRTL